jgi:hypothetical protein
LEAETARFETENKRNEFIGKWGESETVFGQLQDRLGNGLDWIGQARRPFTGFVDFVIPR